VHDFARRLPDCRGALSRQHRGYAQGELRFHFSTFTPGCAFAAYTGRPSPIVGADRRGIDLIVIRDPPKACLRHGEGGVTEAKRARRW